MSFKSQVSQQPPKMKYLILILAFTAAASAEIFRQPCRTRDQLNIKSGFIPGDFLGTWYEIERYEQRFQAGADCVTANYRLNDDGSINVLNRAEYPQNGTKIEAEARALISFPQESPLRAQLNVTFTPLRKYLD